jgi:hypothetical protein
MKKIVLNFLLLLFAVSVKSQNTGIEGQYGILNYGDYTLEGVVENSGIRSTNYGIKIYKDGSVYIGGINNKFISYNDGDLTIQYNSNNSINTPIKEIRYSKSYGGSKTTTKYNNGDWDYKNRIFEEYKVDIKKLLNEEIALARNSINGFSQEKYIAYQKIINGSTGDDKNKLAGKIKIWQSKQVLNAVDCDKLFEDYLFAKDNEMYPQAIQLISINLNKCKKTIDDEISSRRFRAEVYDLNKEYNKAIADLKICEQLIKKTKKNWQQELLIYGQLKKCYIAIGDKNNSELYKSKIALTDNAKRTEYDRIDPPKTSQSESKKYCVSTYKNKYEIVITVDDSNKAYYNLYDNNNKLIKTTKGKWTIKDEGVYGAAYRLTFDFIGANSNLPSMKFTCQYDASGQLQALIDSQDRTWESCR